MQSVRLENALGHGLQMYPIVPLIELHSVIPCVSHFVGEFLL